LDTITHGLFGLTIYGVLVKKEMTPAEKRALLFTSVIASQAPDSDVVAGLTATGEMMKQMWHRGVTHSLFLVPVWGAVFYWLSALIFNVRRRLLFFTACLAAWVHITSDLSNAWGTGYLEPLSSKRFSLGTIPIVDFVYWSAFLAGLLLTWFKKSWDPRKIWRGVALVMAVHFLLQTGQGLWIEHQASKRYDRVELAATFIPWQFRVIGKKGNRVEISTASIWSGTHPEVTLVSDEKADLSPLFAANPKARVLYEWAPFVVVVNDENRLGIYDPRFWRDGESFLAEYIEKRK
jgi:inner membrane protein